MTLPDGAFYVLLQFPHRFRGEEENSVGVVKLTAERKLRPGQIREGKES